MGTVMKPINIISLLLFTFFAITTNARVSSPGLPPEVLLNGTEQQRKGYYFCEPLPDPYFCWVHVGNNPKWASAETYRDAFIIAIGETKIQVEKGQIEIMKVRKQYYGPENPMAMCEKKYETSAYYFHQAWGFAQSRLEPKLTEMSNAIYLGLEALGECEDEWNKGPPIQKSPLTKYYTNANKLTLIMRVIINTMYDRKNIR